MVNVFEFLSYKKYLKATEAERSPLQRGFRSRLAECLACQNAYISQVLNTQANFSLEQALKVSEFLTLRPLETKYFLLLVELERAGTKALQEFFKREIYELRGQALNLEDRIETTMSLTLEQQNLYYSHWIYPAIHVLISVSDYQSPAKIAAALRLDLALVGEVLLFLVSSGLAKEVKGQFLPGATQIHLGKDSPLANQSHTNWRIAAINSLAHKNKQDIHYSTVSSLSFEDAELIKQKLINVIDDYVKTIAPSKEETVYNFNLDFYSLI